MDAGADANGGGGAVNAFLDRHADKITTLSETGCMIWTGAATRQGYGIAFDGKISAAGHKVPEGAHRLSYAAEHGAIPPFMNVLHRCDVPCCVNPDHLFVGTQNDNMQDKISKGRQVRGDLHGMATMTEETVRAIRSEYRFRKVTGAMLAKKYGLNKSAVAAAIRGQNWKHIEGTAP